MKSRLRTDVWAQVELAQHDCEAIHEFFVRTIGIKARKVISNLHLTVYHARRDMPGVVSLSEPIHLIIPTRETRFMVMAPGGENPRPDLHPGRRKVGIRFQRRNAAMPQIRALRERLLQFEAKEVLGSRRPSTHTRNAFGARHFQAHVALLRAGSGIDRDLTRVGGLFRLAIPSLKFDRFEIEVVRREVERS